MVLRVVHAVVQRLEADSRTRQLLLLLLVLSLAILFHGTGHLQWLAHVRWRRLEVIYLMLGRHRATYWGADGAELVLRHTLPSLPLHGEGGDPRQLP
jgi:hypothetical protein